MVVFISDIHGNFPALQSVLMEIDCLQPSRIISLGDIAGYYCMVNECVQAIRERRIPNIMGNHDDYLYSGRMCPRSTIVNKCLDFQRGIITKENMAFLSKSSDGIEDILFSARHGGWNDGLDEYIDAFDFDAAYNKSIIYVSGHTHVQNIQKKGEITYFNPGSVGQPRDGDCRAAYAILRDDGEVSLRRVEYDIDMIAFAMHKNGFDERTYSCLYQGVKIGADQQQNKPNEINTSMVKDGD